MPVGFDVALAPHDVHTTRAAGWNGVRNGRLLALAQERFDAFVTLGKGIVFQHPPGKFALRIVCVRPYSNRLSGVLPYAPLVLMALDGMQEGEVRLLGRLPRGA
jgi:hypothetical protein